MIVYTSTFIFIMLSDPVQELICLPSTKLVIKLLSVIARTFMKEHVRKCQTYIQQILVAYLKFRLYLIIVWYIGLPYIFWFAECRCKEYHDYSSIIYRCHLSTYRNVPRSFFKLKIKEMIKD